MLLGLDACHQRRKLVDGRSISLVTSAIPLDGSVGTAVHIHDLTQPEQRPDGLLIAAVLAVLLVLSAGYFGAGLAVAASDRTGAEKVVGKAVKDNDRIYGLLKNSPSLPGSFNTPDDYIKAKGETDAYGAKATQAHRKPSSPAPRDRPATGPDRRLCSCNPARNS